MKTHTLSPQRDKDFIEACRRHPAWGANRARAAAETALNAAAPRYYVDIEYAYRRTLAMLRHGKTPTRHTSRQLWSELLTKVAAEIAMTPSITLLEAVTRVIAFGKPSRFFISPANAMKIALGYSGTSTRSHNHHNSIFKSNL